MSENLQFSLYPATGLLVACLYRLLILKRRMPLLIWLAAVIAWPAVLFFMLVVFLWRLRRLRL